jgi:hypothetical protein
MTPEEFAKKMEDISKIKNTEEAHQLADALLCDCLRELGYQDGVDIFENMCKWYT